MQLSFCCFFFSWMCSGMFITSVRFHIFNGSELLAADIACLCFLFVLAACQVISQMHQIDYKSPILFISISSIAYFCSVSDIYSGFRPRIAWFNYSKNQRSKRTLVIYSFSDLRLLYAMVNQQALQWVNGENIANVEVEPLSMAYSCLLFLFATRSPK
jgi:hypothetical protein